MKNILLLNKIAGVGLAELDDALYIKNDSVEDPDGILVRSAVMHEMEFGANLEAIARAGAGVNNIPVDRCTEEGIVVFNTPGANANGVKELTLCALLLAARDVVGGITWANSLSVDEDVAKLVEKGKSAFAGTELKGKTLGVIGLGAIGGLVANAAYALGMNVVGCDPFLSVDAAWKLDRHIKHAKTFEDVYAVADYLTLHVPATKDTKGMISKSAIALMKPGAKLINMSRSDLVVAEDVLEALAEGKLSRYVTDFPTPALIGQKNVVAIPHLGASTEEAEDNCAVMAARQLHDFLTDGNITNSVNYPAVSMPRSGESRICVFHTNVPAVLSSITSVVSSFGLNIENMTNKSKGTAAYTMLDICGTLNDEAIEKIAQIDGVVRVKIV